MDIRAMAVVAQCCRYVHRTSWVCSLLEHVNIAGRELRSDG